MISSSYFFLFLPKREECTFKFAKFSVTNPGATFAPWQSIVMIIIVASCMCVFVCVLALPYQFDTTTIFCRSLLPQLLLLTYARLPLFSQSNRPSARVFFLLSSWFCVPLNVNKKIYIDIHAHKHMQLFFMCASV